MTDGTKDAPQPDPATIDRLSAMIAGGRVAQIIAVAAELRLPDLLADGPRSGAHLAEATATHAPTLGRLLRALAALGLLQIDGDRYALTPLGSALRSDQSQRLDLNARYWGQEARWRSWGHLLDSVRTGQAAFPAVFGMPTWEYNELHPEINEVFNEMMTAGSQRRQDAILAAYDFSHFGTVADIGGGHGQLLGTILQRYPNLRGILFDQPHVIAEAPGLLAGLGVEERCTLVPGSFFEAAPTGADAYLLKFILHDWDDQAATAILETVARAMQPGATLLVVDRVLPSDEVPPPGDAISDLHMLVMLGGKERTEDEFRILYDRAGFRLTRVIPTAADVSLVEGHRLQP